MLRVGPTPIVTLTRADALAVGEESLQVYAETVAATVGEGIRAHRERTRVAKTVFSVSLVVFFALIALFLMRKLGQFSAKARDWLSRRESSELAIRIRDFEILGPAATRSALLLSINLLKTLGRIGIAYTWLVFALSLFESTRSHTQKLTGFVVRPLVGLVERTATAVPVLVVVLVAAFGVAVLLRFVSTFFESVARGDTVLSWMPPSLAAPTIAVLRFGIVVAALVFGAPIVTGTDSGAFSRVGLVLLGALGLAAIPFLANGCMGTVALYGARYPLGRCIEFNGFCGTVQRVTLSGVSLETGSGDTLQLSHLSLLWRPFIFREHVAGRVLQVRVQRTGEFGAVRAALQSATDSIVSGAAVRLTSFDQEQAVFAVALPPENARDQERDEALLLALWDAGVTTASFGIETS